jgi:hypothetical protein
MRRLAYFRLPYAENVHRAVMARPVTCPPVTGWPWPGQDVRGALLFFRLHGYPDKARWDGETIRGERVEALTPEQVVAQDLDGCVVIAQVCHGATGAGGAMREAFRDAGARVFVGADAEVFGREGWRLGEADLLVTCLVIAFWLGGWQAGKALHRAKWLYARLAGGTLSREEALMLRSFRAYEA